MTITEFLLARIEEDEQAAKGVHRGRWNSKTALLDHDLYGHISRQHPARVLAECDAKRRIVEQAWKLEFEIDGEWGSSRSVEEMQADGVCPGIIATLASVYADHPDFQDEWRAA